jgi:hypothetical protein
VEIDNWLSPYSSGGSEPNERIGLAVFQFIDRVADAQPMREGVTPDPK